MDYDEDIAPACAVQTIQTGVISVTAGGEVNVSAGTYTELISITKRLTLSGESDVVIHPAENIPDPSDHHRGAIIWVQAPNVTLRDLTIDGDNPAIEGGISVYGADVNAFRGIYLQDHCYDGLTVEHVTLYNLARGINLYCGQDHVIHHNTLYHLGGPSGGEHGFGILLMNNTSAQITNNHVMTATSAGMFIQNNTSAIDTLISHNAITNVSVALGWNGLNGGAHGIVEHNHVYDVNWGMQVTSINNGKLHIQQNTFTLTSSTALGYYTSHTAPDTTYILSNTIIGGNFGIWMKDNDPAFGPGLAYLQVAGNEISDTNYGIVVHSTEADYGVSLQATQNIFSNSSKTALYLTGAAPVTATLGGAPGKGNTFLNNFTNISVTLPHTTPDILAAYNDWGVTDLDEIETTIHHQVDDPELAEVRYYTITAAAPAENVLADGSSTGIITGTLSGLLNPAGNTIAFTTSLGILTPLTVATAPDVATTAATSTDAGAATITATAGYRSATATLTFVPSPVDHFSFDTVEDQIAGRAFTITVSAADEDSNLVTGYTGFADLADATRTLTPTTVGPFTDGVWTGPISITQATVDDILTATHPVDPDVTGQSNVFTVTHNTAITLTLDPPTAILTAGDEITYTVIATDTYANHWAATAAAAYTITPGAGGAWAANTYTAEIAGAWTVTATYQGRGATAALTV
ncbi:MAG: nitrous oxide reductase family maturation protein NosD, partial [Anaerolineales bacterium]